MSEKIIAYSGTTLENYLKCAVVDEKGNVWFDKMREPRHLEPKTFYFDEEFFSASVWAHSCADWAGSGNIPLVMEGEVREEDYELTNSFLILKEGLFFPVTKIWTPKPGINFFRGKQDVQNHYQASEARIFLGLFYE